MALTLKDAALARHHEPSLFPKICFSGFLFLILAFCFYLFICGPQEVLSIYADQKWSFSDETRGGVLLFCMALYWGRFNITLFYLLERKVGWSEVFGLSSFFTLFGIAFFLVGAGAFSKTPVPFSFLDAIALFLFLFGSYLNTTSEIQRKMWKKNPENKGHCYTGGLFRYALHINYFGDALLFTGWALLTANIWSLSVPTFMIFLFITFHIPTLDMYLLSRYGDEFRAYAAKTKKFLPYIY